MKSADDYFERLRNDPEFAEEMSERQRRLSFGQLWPLPKLCESDPKQDQYQTLPHPRVGV
jgi:hypothetical protein